MPWVYAVRCIDGSLHIGHTEDLASREQAHNAGHGARYTAARSPVRIVYLEECASLDVAIKRERQLKRWSIDKKEALIAGDRFALKQLSRRRSVK
jgi:putative endonuclease